ncbi:MAG: hypothetical protein ACI9SI_000075 [Polaribacter sp.]|jgi:hypothetical protein
MNCNDIDMLKKELTLISDVKNQQQVFCKQTLHYFSKSTRRKSLMNFWSWKLSIHIYTLSYWLTYYINE